MVVFLFQALFCIFLLIFAVLLFRQKRALWKYATARAAIAARWTWLQAQISDLEYRIRQHTDLHRQIRSTKGEICLEGPNPPPPASPNAVNGYRGQLPGNTSTNNLKTTTGTVNNSTTDPDVDNNTTTCPDHYQCSRTRPLINFKKRKLLQLSGLHAISKKAARPSTVRCGCVGGLSCAVCTGRTDPSYPRDPTEALSKTERLALVDPTYHPVISMSEGEFLGCGNGWCEWRNAYIIALLLPGSVL